jgi:hypothetical protein
MWLIKLSGWQFGGYCTAATISAQRVEAAQQANAADHKRALDAQRKLREMEIDPD